MPGPEHQTDSSPRLPKVILRVKDLVGHKIAINVRSCPEVRITGTLDSFVFSERQRILVVENDQGFTFVNFDDIAFFKEQ